MAVLLAAAGCSVAVPDPAPSGVEAEACAALLADLPERVHTQARRKVEPGRWSAAWGRPAITLRCGVPAPPGLDAGSPCLEVNGVGWYDEDAQGGRLFTTIGRAVYVEVAVPDAYAPEPEALVDVAATIAAHDPLRQPCR